MKEKTNFSRVFSALSDGMATLEDRRLMYATGYPHKDIYLQYNDCVRIDCSSLPY